MGDQAASITEPQPATHDVAFGGNLHGGPNPIVGATVKLYATGSSSPGTSSDGYGIGTEIAEAVNQSPGGTTPGYDTSATGAFTFAGVSYTCPAKQFAYVVASGGNPGGGINNAVVLVAALGRCEDLTTSTVVYINELTTVAAGYALGRFATVTGTTPTTVAVGIGAPITNNSQTFTDANGHSAGCIKNSFYNPTNCPATVAAGLYHAFLNAATLMPTATYAVSAPATLNGATYSATVAVLNNKLLNSIANALVACVNSAGATSPACAIVFGATTIGGVAPTNTFQAMINLAANPTFAGTSNPNATPTPGVPYTPAAFLGAASSATNVYTPALPTSYTNLQDMEVTVYYPGSASSTAGIGWTSTSQGLDDAWAIGLDINDTVYVGSDTGTGTGSTAGVLLSFSSTGTLLSQTNTNTTTATELGYPSPDGLGNVYTCGGINAGPAYVHDWTVTKAGVITNTPTVAQLSVVSGTPCGGIAVDQAGNVWASDLTGSIYSTYNVFEIPSGGFANGTVCPYNLTSSANTLATASGCTGVMDLNNTGITAAQYLASGMMVDPHQNIWVANQLAAAAGAVTVLENTGTVSAPVYTFQSCITGSGSGATTTTGTACGTSGQIKATTTYASMGGIDSFNLVAAKSSATAGYTVWANTNVAATTTTNTANSGIQPFVPTLSTDTVTSVAAGTFAQTVYDAQDTAGNTQLFSLAADGAGNVFTADKGANQWMVTTPAGTNIGLWPCTLKYSTSSTNGCTGTAPASPSGIAIDSTGTVWVGASTTGMFQIFGLAAPTWPQLSLGKVGMP